MIEEIVKANRSYRRFHQDKAVETHLLRNLVNMGRLSPSAANLQPLKYVICNDPKLNARVFPTTMWAGYLKDWPGPQEGERPAAYIVILGDTEISKGFGCDHGIAAQSIMLGATELGLRGCMIGAFKREPLRAALQVSDRYEILLVLALGKPAERVALESVPESGDIKYWRDAQDVHHVPKRRLEDIIID